VPKRVLLLLVMAVVIAGIGWIDIITGPNYGMSLLYLAPVVITAWYVSLTAGIVLAIGAAASWIISELDTHESVTLAMGLWNGFTRLVIYTGTASLLGLLRADRMRLRQLLQQAEATARTDALTGLANSRAFHERLREEAVRVQRYHHPLTIAYVDVDNFKRVNDRYGHTTGDDVLKEIADALRGVVRTGDLTARLGGDEFAVAMWEMPADDAKGFEQRLGAALAPIIARYPDTGLGASVGFETLGPDGSLVDVLRAADEAMYAAKAARKTAG